MDKPTVRNWCRLAVAAVSLAGLVACGGGNGGTTALDDGIQDLAGQYQLVTSDNAPIPVNILFDNCEHIQVRSGELQLSDDGSWQMLIHVLDPQGNPRDETDQGQFSRAGNRLQFQSEDYGDQFRGELQPPLVHLYYDWCGEGSADAEFGFSAN
jgi:hypothetical protein